MKENKNPAIRTAVGNFLFWLIAFVYLEALLHSQVFDGFTAAFGYTVGFSAGAALVMSLLLGFLPRKANAVVSGVLALLLAVVYGSQIVYYAVFGSLYSLAMMALGGDALGAFWKETAMTMKEIFPTLVLLFGPLVLEFHLARKLPFVFRRTDKRCRIGQAVALVVVQVVTVLCLQAGGTGYFSNYYFYNSPDSTVDQMTERFGLVTSMRLELTPRSEDTAYLTSVEPTPTPEVPVEYNVLEIDFDELNAQTEDKKILAINEYCASLSGTNKNEYTGMLRDYNLILICAESFATGVIDPELTPTLYRLANEGIIFNNYYNAYPNTTTDGEYSLCQGLWPDTSRDKSASSFYASRNSYIPFALGNVFLDQLGIQSNGYHNYYGSYYGRKESHPNLGYDMQFAGKGMKFTVNWPASDLEMMEQSVDDYITQDQFHTYYMTFSGHYKYDVNINPMVQRNWDEVKKLDQYSDAVKAYISCNLEFEKAMAYLMERLEEEGIADKTAIVIAGDHFPYGLKDKEYEELVGYELDGFNKYKSTLIFWVGGLEENIEVDEYCCNVDVLPTILNLWGFDYDSRLLAGTDVFSDGEHMAVRIDKSFYTDKVWLNASTGEIRYLVPESELPEGYVEGLIQTVKNKFTISSDILTKAYYNFVFDKGKVKVNTNAWR